MSTIKATTLSTQSNATVSIDTVVNGTAKAWVNFNGTGTVAIRASFNVSSITDIGVGSYQVNVTTALPDTNYAVTGTSRSTSVGAVALEAPATAAGVTTSSFNMFTYKTTTGAGTDAEYVQVAIFR